MSDATAVTSNALDDAFRRGRPALVCYLPLGDPAAPYADPRRYVDEGVDVLEVGVPAPDPSLDGPAISTSMRRALDNGMTNERAADAVASFREAAGAPATVWMTYPSMADRPGFRDAVAASRVDGLLVAGAVPGRFPPSPGVHDIRFLPHRPSPAEVAAALDATGYVMVAADDGVSGVRADVAPENAELLARLRAAGVTAPLALGFGISDAAQVRSAVTCGADGVIVGTAMLLAGMESPDAVRRLLRALRQALDG